MSDQVLIAEKYNGPPTSGNGGYSCGVLAAHVDGAARVRLFQPPPLETAMEIRPMDTGQVDMYHGDTLVGSAWPATLDMAVPAAPTLEQAREASNGYMGLKEHAFPGCYVCGPERMEDGLCLFPGPVSDWQLLACTWQPSPDCLDEQGRVRPEIIWSALDCPGYFGAHGPTLAKGVLGELTAELHSNVQGDQELIVYCWPIAKEGRKSQGGTAIASADGTVLAASHSLWIELQ